MMKAILCEEWGNADGLRIRELPLPAPSPGHVTVNVTAVALNFFDTLIIAGKYQVKPPLPFIPGGELAGVVDAVGPGVEGFTVGQQVMAHVGYGALCEQVNIRAERVIPVPEQVAPPIAASLSITYGTSLYALKDRAKIKFGERVAILGAAGGAGLAAVEIASRLGAEVIACASTNDKLTLCRQHGAEHTLNYTDTELRAGLNQITNDEGVDVIFDPLGGEYSEQALRALAWNGRLLVVGFAAGSIPELPLNLLLLKNCAAIGVNLGGLSQNEPELHRANITQLLKWVQQDRLRPHIGHVLPLESTAEAFRLINSRQARGKIIIQVAQ